MYHYSLVLDYASTYYMIDSMHPKFPMSSAFWLEALIVSLRI